MKNICRTCKNEYNSTLYYGRCRGCVDNNILDNIEIERLREIMIPKRVYKTKELKDMEGREFVREKARIRDNRMCQLCEKKWKKGERRFDIHHKDCLKEKSKKYDNWEKEKDNMVTLCHKCHGMIHTFARMDKTKRKTVIHNIFKKDVFFK